MISGITLFFAMIFAPGVVILWQAILFRRFPKHGAQLLTMASMLLGYPTYFFLLSRLTFSWERDFSFYSFFFLFYSFVAYAYFHVFNMSETSRRVRLLSRIGPDSLLSEKELQAIFEEKEMLLARMERLEALGQCSLREGKYYPEGKLFSRAAIALFEVGKLLKRPWPAMEKFKREI